MSDAFSHHGVYGFRKWHLIFIRLISLLSNSLLLKKTSVTEIEQNMWLFPAPHLQILLSVLKVGDSRHCKSTLISL